MNINNEELHAVSTVQGGDFPPSMETTHEDEPRYVPIGGVHKVVPRHRLKAAGWTMTKTMRPVTQVVPDTWLDSVTGEIITKAHARKRGIRLPVARSTSDKVLAMGERLADCTPSELPFVRYLLRMRNHRGGLVHSLDAVLDRWISRERPGMRSTDKARKRKQLRSIIERRNLMVNDMAMAKDLQILNPNITKQDILEEGARLYTM